MVVIYFRVLKCLRASFCEIEYAHELKPKQFGSA